MFHKGYSSTRELCSIIAVKEVWTTITVAGIGVWAQIKYSLSYWGQSVHRPKLSSAIVVAKLEVFYQCYAMAFSRSSIALPRIFNASWVRVYLKLLWQGTMNEEVCAVLVIQSCQNETWMGRSKVEHLLVLNCTAWNLQCVIVVGPCTKSRSLWKQLHYCHTYW